MEEKEKKEKHDKTSVSQSLLLTSTSLVVQNFDCLLSLPVVLYIIGTTFRYIILGNCDDRGLSGWLTNLSILIFSLIQRIRVYKCRTVSKWEFRKGTGDKPFD